MESLDIEKDEGLGLEIAQMTNIAHSMMRRKENLCIVMQFCAALPNTKLQMSLTSMQLTTKKNLRFAKHNKTRGMMMYPLL